MSASIRFVYDIVSPKAYLASQILEPIAHTYGRTVLWTPVSMSQLRHIDTSTYTNHKISNQKRILLNKDLIRRFAKYQIEVNRSLTAANTESCEKALQILCQVNDQQRAQLSHEMFRAYWIEKRDLNDDLVLSECIENAGVNLSNSALSNQVEVNTMKFVENGGFDVPSIFIDEHLFYGADRFHFIEAILKGSFTAPPERRPIPVKSLKFRFYLDFGSPWCFLGWTQLWRCARYAADVELVPILLGAVFKAVGTPNVPSLAASESKRAYSIADISRWQQWWGESLQFPKFFPLRAVLPLRVAIIEPKTVDCLFRAVWQQNLNIGEAEVLREVLNDHEFDGNDLISRTQDQDIKDKLRANTEEAIRRGVIGVPTYEVNDQLIWGQDRIENVQDLLCGERIGVNCRL